MIVWNTIANMQVLDASLESFFLVLEDEISSQNCWEFRDSINLPGLKTPNGWCWYAVFLKYSLGKIPKGEGRNRGRGNLTVGVELWREVIYQEKLWEHAKQALIYVGYSPRKDDYWSDDMALDCLGSPTRYTDGEIAKPDDKGNPYLWTWNGQDEDRWSRRDWFFVLPLGAIGRREDIENEIISPVRSLLINNCDSNTAFTGKQAVGTVVAAGP